MEASRSRWLMTTGLVFVTAIILGGQGEVEDHGNNLATSTIFAEGHGVTGWPTSLDTGLRPTAADLATSGSTDPTVPYWDDTEIHVKDNVTYYPQQTPSYWRADVRDGISLDPSVAEEHVIINWSDNLLNTRWYAGSVIRVETAMYQDAIDPADTMTAYTMEYLFGEGTTEMWGADQTTYESSRRAVFSAAARLKIEKISGPGGSVIPGPSSFNGSVAEGFEGDGPGAYGAEINVSGNLVYGYNWTLSQWPGTDAEKAGWWRLTFALDPTVNYTLTSEVDGSTTSYTVNRNAMFDGPDPSDTALSSFFRPRLVDPYTTVLDIEILESQTGGQPTLPLGVTLAGTGSGSVTSTPAGIACPGDCSENYARNEIVTLDAVADRGSRFTGWSGDADCVDGQVTMEGGRYCTATFMRPGRPALTAEADGPIITLSWTAPSDTPWITGYRLAGGISPGGADVSMDVGTQQTTVTTTVAIGRYFARVYGMLDGIPGLPSNEVSVSYTGAPSRPQAALVGVDGSHASLTWRPPIWGPVISYEVHVGTAPGWSNLGVIPVGAGSPSLGGDVGDGVYYVRVYAVNGGGRSLPSNEVMFVVGAGIPGEPGTPSSLTAIVSGDSVFLSWVAGTGGTPTGHLLLVGSAPGATDLGIFGIGGSTSFLANGIASGTYYVRLVATNADGESEPSAEIVVIVP